MESSIERRHSPGMAPRRSLLVVGCAIALISSASPLAAATDSDGGGEPAAIIEAIDAASVTDLGFMDFVYEGKRILLAENETLTLSYLRSCRVEEISGGSVTVGRSKSEVSGPIPVVVTEVDCDGGGIVPTERQGEDVAALVFRDASQDGEDPVRVNSTTPLFAFSEPVEELVIEPHNDDGRESFRLAVEGRRLDLADRGVTLEPGGIYRATAGQDSVLIRIEKGAMRRGRSLLERLIAF